MFINLQAAAATVNSTFADNAALSQGGALACVDCAQAQVLSIVENNIAQEVRCHRCQLGDMRLQVGVVYQTLPSAPRARQQPSLLPDITVRLSTNSLTRTQLEFTFVDAI